MKKMKGLQIQFWTQFSNTRMFTESRLFVKGISHFGSIDFNFPPILCFKNKNYFYLFFKLFFKIFNSIFYYEDLNLKSLCYKIFKSMGFKVWNPNKLKPIHETSIFIVNTKILQSTWQKGLNFFPNILIKV